MTTDVLNSIVRVDRRVRPTYPDWMRKVMHPKLELTGPPTFYVGELEQYLDPPQVNGTVRGNAIYKNLKDEHLLGGCLGFADLRAIQALGLENFREYFAGKAVFGWKSVVQGDDGYLFAPCLVESEGRVVLGWRWIHGDWRADNPALRFCK